MEVPPLVIGLPIAPSLPSGSEANLATPGIERFDSVAAACRKAKATFVTSWSTDPNDSSMHTVAMGCDDGSVFVFESCAPVHRRPEPPQLQLPLRSPYDIPRSTSPSAASAASVASFRSAPSSSPTTASVRTQTTISMAGGPPTLVQPRARVLSSVSKPSIEAPKTFVDYDNEPDNLRSMLKANSTSGNRRDKKDKEKGKDKENKSGKEDESTSGSTSGPEDDSAPGTGASSRGSTDKSTPVVLSPPALTFRAFPSANPATPTTPMAFRLPSSPHQLHDLRLKMHVAPPRIGFGHSVTSIKVLEGGSLLASLQECGALTLFSTTDGTCISSVRMDEMPRLKPPTGCKSLPQHLGLYTWSGIRVAQDEGSTLLFLSGSDISESPTAHQPDTSLSTRVVVIRVKTLYERGFVTSSVQVLEKIGEWVQDGPARGVGLHIDDRGELLVYRLSSSSNLVFRSIHILPPHPSPQSDDASDENEKEQQSSGSAFLPHLPIHIPNPFKSSTPATSPRSHRFFSRRRPTSYYHAPEYQPDAEWEYGRIELGDEFDLGETGFADGSGKNKDDDYADEVGPISGVSITVFGRATVGCVWSDTRVSAFSLPSDRKPLRKLCSWTCDSSRGVSWIEENSLVVLNQDAITLYNLVIGEPQNVPTASEEEWISNSQIQVTRRPELVMSIPVEGMQISCLLNPSLLLAITSNESRTALRLRSVAIKSLPDSSTSSRKRRGTHDAEILKKRCRVVWEDSLSTIYDGGKAVINKPQAVTSILPVNLNEIILGLDDGNIIVHDLDTAICPEPISLSPLRKSESGMECPVLSLHLVKNARTEQQYIIGSSDDGSLSVWSLSDLKRCSRWTLFATPLLTIIDLTGDPNAGRLKNCLLCVAEHGTIAVISVEDLELLYLIPGSSSPLERICLGGDQLILIYADGKGRLWNLITQEFWRSMPRDKAEELIQEGEWFIGYVEQEGPHVNETYGLGAMQTTATSTDLASSLIVDVREFIEASRRASEIQAQATGKATGSATWKSLRPVLAALLVGSSTLDTDLNQLVTSMLGTGGLTDVAKASLFNGLRGACTSLVGQTNMDVWKISPEHTALRLLATLSLLRTASLVEDFDSLANQVATLLTSSLGDIIGDGFRYPSLETLAQYLYDPCIEVKQAARSLFFAETQRLPDLDAVSLVEVIRHRLPTLQPDSHKESSYAALALVVTGHVTVENYTLISTETLTDISKSIALYLHDEHSEHRVIAIELCSAGFHIWQHYVDAMAALRSLFTLATSQRKDGVSAQARSAVLQIASTNTPLFMTTLSLDVLNPPSLEYRKTIMQLVAFIIRKKPLVLYPNLPRLVEAVVKSLDPNSAASREMVLDTATEILGHVVSTFPTVDFHKASQRLAVGTGEGAVIMYDLKTATRLYVLEGHKKRVTAISFSPDGRRLATVSLEESVVMGWKVGSSFSSFFHPGAPPWQGSSGSDPFKKLEFNVGDEAHMTIASTLDWVAFEWPNERTVRLKIRDSVLTFST